MTSPNIIFGDVNGDGIVDISDVAYLAKAVAGDERFPMPSNIREILPYIENNATIKQSHVIHLQKYLAGVEGYALDYRPKYHYGMLTENTTWYASDDNRLSGVVVVPNGIVLTIEKGATIKMSVIETRTPPMLVILRGGKLIASGTESHPIRFGYNEYWGGIVILGNAPIDPQEGASTKLIELSTAFTELKKSNEKVFENELFPGPDYYGGMDPTDDAGASVLQYLQIYYCGLEDSEHKTGLTLAGVGRSTIIENIEVANCRNTGIQCLGGCVNLKYISIVYANEHSIDIRDGYTGNVQFVYINRNDVDCLGHGIHIDSGVYPRTHPRMCNVTLMGGKESAIKISSNCGGDFRNFIIVDVLTSSHVIVVEPTGEFLQTQQLNNAYFRYPDYLYISPNFLLYSNTGILFSNNFTGLDEGYHGVYKEPGAVKVLPTVGGAAFQDIDDTFTESFGSDYGFFVDANYKGAFDDNVNWLSEWSILSHIFTENDQAEPEPDVIPPIFLDVQGNEIDNNVVTIGVFENVGINYYIYTVRCNERVSFSLDSYDSEKFIVSQTGIYSYEGDIRILFNPDFEDSQTQPKYEFNIRATDKEGNTNNLAIIVNINDVDEIKPQFLDASGQVITSDSVSIFEKIDEGSVIYIVRTNEDVLFSLMNTNNFEIDNESTFSKESFIE